MDRERLERIGKFLNDRMIIHRNVENNTPWTTEEKMIQELYDNYLDILIKYKKQKEVNNKAIEYIQNHQLVFKYATLEEIEVWFNQFYINVLDILNEVSK